MQQWLNADWGGYARRVTSGCRRAPSEGRRFAVTAAHFSLVMDSCARFRPPHPPRAVVNGREAREHRVARAPFWQRCRA